MYSIIQSVINAGSFELTGILRKIDTLWLKGDIDDDRRTELFLFCTCIVRRYKLWQ